MEDQKKVCFGGFCVQFSWNGSVLGWFYWLWVLGGVCVGWFILGFVCVFFRVGMLCLVLVLVCIFSFVFSFMILIRSCFIWGFRSLFLQGKGMSSVVRRMFFVVGRCKFLRLVFSRGCFLVRIGMLWCIYICVSYFGWYDVCLVLQVWFLVWI